MFPFQPSVFRSFDRIELTVIPYLAVVLFLFVELVDPLVQLVHPLSAKLILKNGAEIGVNLHTVNIQPPVTVTAQRNILLHDSADNVPFPGLGFQDVFDFLPVNARQKSFGQGGRGGIKTTPRLFRGGDSLDAHSCSPSSSGSS